MIRTKLLAAVGCALMVVSGQPSIGAEKGEEPADFEPTIEQLRAQRVKALRLVVQQSKAMYQEGSIEIGAVLEAQKSLTAALLDGEPSADKRRELLQQQLKIAQEFENRAKRMVEAGRSSSIDYLRAKADRLEVQIQLRQAGDRSP